MEIQSAPIYIGFLSLYFILLLGVGFVKARQIKSQADFSLAGRGLSTFVLVGTLLATWIGTGSIFGNAEETYRVGVAAFLIPVSGALGILALYYLAPRIRGFEQFTIQDILESRFGAFSRIVGSLTALVAYVIIVSYQYRAGAAIVERLMPNMGHVAAVGFVGVFVILYTFLAGMYSVAYTGVINGGLLLVGFGITVPLLVGDAGGISGVLASLEPQKKDLLGTYGLAELLSISLPPFLLLLGDANMYTRFFAAKDPASAKRSAYWMFWSVLLVECAIIFLSLVCTALVAQGKMPAPENPGHIIVQAAFHALSPFLGALLVATVVSVIVDTADSYLLAPASSLVRDIYQRFLDPSASERNIVLVSRAMVVVLGLVAFAMAFLSREFFKVSLFAYTIYGASITPALMAAFFWDRATPAGAIASMVTGAVTAVGWKVLVSDGLLGGIAQAAGWGGLASCVRAVAEMNLDAVIPATAASVVALVLVSLATARKPADESAMPVI